MNIKKLLISLAFLFGAASGVRAQHVGLKTNLLGDATLSPNLGLEFGLAPKWSLDVTGQVNFWNINDHRWRHWLAQPELRYWFCERFAGHFLGFHALGGMYNLGNLKNNINFLGSDFSKLTDRRYQGWAAGLGVAYGHAWVLGMHWNLELELGIGWLYTRYDVYPCAECGTKIANDRDHHYFGPTKAALNLVYLF